MNEYATQSPSFSYRVKECFVLYFSFLYNAQHDDFQIQIKQKCCLLLQIPRCPKYRRSVLNAIVQKELKTIIEETCRLRKSEILAMELMADHVHLLVEVDPQYGIHKLIKEIKGKSSRILRLNFSHLRSRLPTLWTNSYFVSTVGGAPLSVIKQYVENQKAV